MSTITHSFKLQDLVRVIGVKVYCGEYYDDRAMKHIGKITIIDFLGESGSKPWYRTKLGWWAEEELELVNSNQSEENLQEQVESDDESKLHSFD